MSSAVGGASTRTKAYSGHCFEAHVMPFDSLDSVLSRVSSVAIHDEGDVSWYRSLSQRAEEQLAHLRDRPFGWWGFEEPST